MTNLLLLLLLLLLCLFKSVFMEICTLFSGFKNKRHLTQVSTLKRRRTFYIVYLN